MQKMILNTYRIYAPLIQIKTILGNVMRVQGVFRYLCEESSETFREKNFVPDVRRFIMKLLIAGEDHDQSPD